MTGVNLIHTLGLASLCTALISLQNLLCPEGYSLKHPEAITKRNEAHYHIYIMYIVYHACSIMMTTFLFDGDNP